MVCNHNHSLRFLSSDKNICSKSMCEKVHILHIHHNPHDYVQYNCGNKWQTVKSGCCLTLCIHSCVTIALINSWPCIRGMERCCKDIGTSQAGALERSRATSLPPRAPRSHPPAMWGRCTDPLLLLLPLALGQFEEEEKPYRGQLVGSLNSYHHQVSLGSRASILSCILLNPTANSLAQHPLMRRGE